MRCSERLFIVDEGTKTVVWSNDLSVSVGSPCYNAFFGKTCVCDYCPQPKENELYQWDVYDDVRKCWIKVKSILFRDGGRLLRAVNFNAMNDAMNLSRDSIELASDLQKLLNENERIKNAFENQASHDLMTGLFNRNRFNLDMASGLFDGGGTGILYFDLNNLKLVNDTLRHEAGDRLIMCLANAISVTAEQYNAHAYRVGGDEFVLIFIGISSGELDGAQTFFYNALDKNQTQPPCIVAVGKVYSESGCDAEKLISAADHEMYLDKQRLKSQKPTK